MHVRLLTTVLCFTTFSKIGLLPLPVLAGSMLARVLIHPPGPTFTLFHPFLPAPPCLVLSRSLLLHSALQPKDTTVRPVLVRLEISAD